MESNNNIGSLIQGLRANDSNCQKIIFQQYYGFVMSITLRYTNDRYQAEEVLNDSFMKVFSKIESFDINGPFKPWLARIVVNTSLDQLRKNSKLPSFRELSNQDYETIEDNSQSLDMNCDDLLKIIQTLPPQYKSVFNLYVFEGYKHREIAKLLDISESTSKSNYSRAKNLIRKQYGTQTALQQLQIQRV